ncbi:MAG: acyl-protein synthetase [Lachnospiraceae bacterium]|jgi:phenylacetate-coenzyme A ligase PaaK-like adenylate-forming protein|nr:acyl-protein synthetase [Lachnospiraceae bacterium]
MEEILKHAPYEDDHVQKNKILSERLDFLTRHHYENCKEYQNFIDKLCGGLKTYENVEDIPFLPVGIFKRMELKSISDDEVFKIMTSSGTSGQQVSRIFLDKETAGLQQKVLASIVTEYTGKSRMPMIILDCPSVLKNRNMFSARGAGILGFSLFGTKKVYAFNDDMELNVAELKEFIKQYEGQTILLFGFTFMIWQYFYKKLAKLNEYLPLENGVLIHGGGWKKLENEAVSKEEFKEGLKKVCGITSVHDYYGMVEQTGCIYMECECGHLHASIYSDVIIRNMEDFSVCSYGKTGAIQVLSTLPYSYPGHSILTEDIGCVLGEDDCPCGRKGKYFEVYGRMKNAEVRGCSDTFER